MDIFRFLLRFHDDLKDLEHDPHLLVIDGPDLVIRRFRLLLDFRLQKEFLRLLAFKLPGFLLDRRVVLEPDPVGLLEKKSLVDHRGEEFPGLDLAFQEFHVTAMAIQELFPQVFHGDRVPIHLRQVRGPGMEGTACDKPR